MFGEFSHISLAFFATSLGIAFRSGKKPFAFVSGMRCETPPAEAGPDRIDRIAGARDEHDIARIDECEGNVPDAFLRADQRQHFVGRIQRDMKRRLYQSATALRNDSMPSYEGYWWCFGFFGGLCQAFDDRRRRRQIGIADAEIDDIDALGNRRLLHLVDGGEQIGRQCLDSGGNFDGETSHNRHISFLQEASCETSLLGYFRTPPVINARNAADKDKDGRASRCNLFALTRSGNHTILPRL